MLIFKFNIKKYVNILKTIDNNISNNNKKNNLYNQKKISNINYIILFQLSGHKSFV